MHVLITLPTNSSWERLKVATVRLCSFVRQSSWSGWEESTSQLAWGNLCTKQWQMVLKNLHWCISPQGIWENRRKRNKNSYLNLFTYTSIPVISSQTHSKNTSLIVLRFQYWLLFDVDKKHSKTLWCGCRLHPKYTIGIRYAISLAWGEHCLHIHVFLEISPYFEILPPSKCHHMFLSTYPNKCHTLNFATW